MPVDPRRIEVIGDRTAEIFRRMSAAQKWEAVDRLVTQAREMIESIVRPSHPTWDKRAVQFEVPRRFARGTA